MDEHEEKTKEIKKSTHHTDDITSNLPPVPTDLYPLILSRLPAKSIIRFRCVSNLWSSLTTHPDFINSFAIHSTSRPPNLLLTFSTKTKRFVLLIPQNPNPDRTSTYQITTPTDLRFRLSSYIHGLALSRGLIIWNPSLPQFKKLPIPNENNPSDQYAAFLCYDPIRDKHKILYLNREESWIITLSGEETWRVVKTVKHRPLGRDGKCYNGVLYYFATVNTLGDNPVIMSFNVSSEEFNNPIIFAEDGGCCRVTDRMAFYDGSLAIVRPHTYFNCRIDLYVLSDPVQSVWTHEYFNLPSPYNDVRESKMRFQGVTDGGEFFFTPCLS